MLQVKKSGWIANTLKQKKTKSSKANFLDLSESSMQQGNKHIN